MIKRNFKNMIRRICCFGFVLAALSVQLYAQNQTEENAEIVETSAEDEIKEPLVVRASILNGPTSIPAAYMMDKLERQKRERPEEFDQLQITFEKFADPQALLPKLLKKEIDVAFLPVNVAAKVYNSSNKAIVCAAITGNTNLVLITKDKNINDISDLSGKTVYVAGQGATPEYMFRFILNQNNLSNVTLDYSIPPANLPAQIISDKIEYAVVPEPFATIALLKSNAVVCALDLQKEYSRITGPGRVVPFTVIVARKDYAKDHADALNAYLSMLEESLNWTVENPQQAAKFCEKYGIGLSVPVVTNAIPKSNYVYVSGSEAKNEVEELMRIFYELDKASIGNKLPDEGFFYINE